MKLFHKSVIILKRIGDKAPLLVWLNKPKQRKHASAKYSSTVTMFSKIVYKQSHASPRGIEAAWFVCKFAIRQREQ